ncbi:MAG TPA: Hsp20/alpha crystallin family protein [Dehalococcoidia bacterium]|jgi:HSP20 family protein|nr:Hsp20/alpha crystallin family protein [Dehalococcoidia bacterium]
MALENLPSEIRQMWGLKPYGGYPEIEQRLENAVRRAFHPELARGVESPRFQPTYPPSLHPEVWGRRPLTDLGEIEQRLENAIRRAFHPELAGVEGPAFQPTYPPSLHPEVWGRRPLTDLDEMERHFEDVMGRVLHPEVWKHRPIEERHWAPPVEMFEKEDKFVIKVELPGMKAEDVDASVVGDRLVVKGERKSETEVKEEDYYTCERLYGRCSRAIALPTDADAEKIEASFEDGVLEVTFPKTAEVKAKKIPVSVKKKASK